MKTSLIGHPLAHIGMGEQLRSGIRSLQAVHIDVEVIDVYNFLPRSDPDHRRLLSSIESSRVTGSARVFHINGDEVSPVLAHMEGRKLDFKAGYNIIVPAWELPTYPEAWAEELQKFDEVWALSRFIQQSLERSGISSNYVGQSVQIPFRPFLGRRYFSIRESAFVFLNFFDVSSFPARKNPKAIIRFFREVRRRRPYDDMQLVMKIKGGDVAVVEALAEFRREFPDVVIIDDTLTTAAVHSLLVACDCFVSLHRSEGFGRGPAEAMFAGRLALVTGWSGNVDYMDAGSPLMVPFSLVPVGADEYPHADGQLWAEPDVDYAVETAIQLFDKPVLRADITRRQMRLLHGQFSDRAVGLRSLTCLEVARELRQLG